MSAGLISRLAMIPMLCWLTGCGLNDSAEVECRCTPGTNLNLFPACPEIAEVAKIEEEEYWITAEADTLSPATDWIIVKGSAVRFRRANTGNPFATQIPDCPSGQLLVLHEPTRPENVLANMRTIFMARPETRNPGQYMDQLTEDFTFVPKAEDVQNYPNVYDASRDTLWNRKQERSFAQAIFDPNRIHSIRFIRWYESAKDERIPSEDQRRETFIFPYEAEFTTVQKEIIAIKGEMEVDLVTPTLENPVWSIEQWRDMPAATAKWSWGELRAEFAR